jgi:hypothetical protein
MNTVGLTVPQLRLYYRETLSGDGVCTITEDEFVVEYQHFKAQGKLLPLVKIRQPTTRHSCPTFSGYPPTVKKLRIRGVNYFEHKRVRFCKR